MDEHKSEYITENGPDKFVFRCNRGSEGELMSHMLDMIFDDMIHDEYVRNRILLKVETEPSTVQEISDEINVDTEEVFKHVARLWKRQIILMEGHKGDYPLFIKAGGGD